jgi:hypothetical protein
LGDRLLLLLAVVPALCLAQTPQKIVEEHLRALGGAKTVAKVQSAIIAGNLTEESTGKTGSFSLMTKAPNRFYTETIAGQDRFIEAYNGMSAWGQDPAESAHTLTGTATNEAEATGRYWNSHLADLKKSKISLQMASSEKARGRDADHLKVLLGPGLTRDVFMDSGTHLIVRETLPSLLAGGGRVQIDYDDYRPVNGIQTPYRIEVQRGGHTYKIAVTRAEFGAAVDDAVFNFPAAAGAPVPDIKSLILDVTRNQRAIEEMQKQYTCHVTTEEEKVDSKSQMTSKTVKEFEVFYVGGDEVRRLIAKDGKPLAGDEKKKEDDRFNKEFEKLQKQLVERAADPKRQKKQNEKEEAQISDFLRAVRFSNARRERFRGQDVIAVDFGPNPDYKPKKAIENIVQKLAGVVWIDEKARDVARLEAHFSNSVKIGAGLLASVDKGTSIIFEQAKINDEVWLPTYAEIHASGRLLVVKLKANEIDRYTDYKKFSAESRMVTVKE